MNAPDDTDQPEINEARISSLSQQAMIRHASLQERWESVRHGP
jgi:hypothetical protein